MKFDSVSAWASYWSTWVCCC